MIQAVTRYTKGIATCAVLGALGGMAIANCGGSGSSGTGANGGSGIGSGGTTGTGCTSTPSTPYSCDLSSGAVDPANLLLTDFTSAGNDAGEPASWSMTNGKWGVSGNLTGSIFAYRGPKTTTTEWPDASVTNGALTDMGTVESGDYAGIGMAFDQCVNAPAITGVSFTLQGSLGGCTLQFQLQTLDEQASSNHGKCDTCTATCYGFPKESLNLPNLSTTAPTTVTVNFSDLANTGTPAAVADFAAEMIGFQWHLQAGSTGTCSGVSLAVDNVAFVMGSGGTTSSTTTSSSTSASSTSTSSSSGSGSSTSSSSGSSGSSSSGGGDAGP